MDQVCVALDLETTGIDPQRDEIIEIGAVKFLGRQELERFVTLVDPGRPVPAQITALTGITTTDLQGAPTPAVGVERLRAFLGAAPVVGQHLDFDLSFLQGQGLVLANPVYDTFELGRMLWPALRSYSLANLARQVGAALKPAHRALPDALRAREVLLALWERALALDPLVRLEVTRLLARVGRPEAHFLLALEASQGERRGNLPVGVPTGQWNKEGSGPASPPVGTGVGARAPEAVGALLRSDGPLARVWPQFEERPQQESMASAVAAAFAAGEHLLVEAGTGTGKSLAYLLPAVLLAVAQGERIVVSTNTINLQEQLVSKDIPGLETALVEGGLIPPGLLRARPLKGRANYLCLQRLQGALGAAAAGADEAKLLCRLLVWMADGGSGDVSEIALNAAEQSLWVRLSAQSGNCSVQCPPRFRAACPLQRSRQEAEGCHIVVVNHALLLSDLVGESRRLPDHDYLVVDEAHHLEDQATEQMAFRVGVQDMVQLLDALNPQLLPELRQHLRGSAAPQAAQQRLLELAEALALRGEGLRVRGRDFFLIVSSFLGEQAERQGDYERRLRLTPGARAQPLWAEVEQAWATLALHYEAVEEGLEGLLFHLGSLEQTNILDYEGLVARLSAVLMQLAAQRERLDGAVANPQADIVYWGTLSSQGAPALAGAPLEVGPMLRKRLFDQKRSVILTSATLSTEGTFEYIRGRLGLEGPRELVLDSPFDYRAAALVCVPRDMPEPAAAAQGRAGEEALAAIAVAAQGRTLALFTSHAALRAARDELEPRLQRQGIVVLAQGVDGAPAQLLDRFREGEATLLMGTSSFWEGVDVVGEALSVVVVVKLPFAVPTDPIFAARSELFEEPFNHYALPQAVLRFKQGFGRLIRSRTDRGVLVVLDRRVLSRSYGRAFLQSLPSCTVARPTLKQVGAAVRSWLEGGRP